MVSSTIDFVFYSSIIDYSSHARISNHTTTAKISDIIQTEWTMVSSRWIFSLLRSLVAIFLDFILFTDDTPSIVVSCRSQWSDHERLSRCTMIHRSFSRLEIARRNDLVEFIDSIIRIIFKRGNWTAQWFPPIEYIIFLKRFDDWS